MRFDSEFGLGNEDKDEDARDNVVISTTDEDHDSAGRSPTAGLEATPVEVASEVAVGIGVRVGGDSSGTDRNQATRRRHRSSNMVGAAAFHVEGDDSLIPVSGTSDATPPPNETAGVGEEDAKEPDPGGTTWSSLVFADRTQSILSLLHTSGRLQRAETGGV